MARAAKPTKPTAKKRLAQAFVQVAVLSGALSEASANPPPPRTLPDPKPSAPVAAEAPNFLRRHMGGCFAYWPSGGVARIDCPPELAKEPLGEGLRRNPSGTCDFVPFISGLPGAVGPTPCPAVLTTIATPGVLPSAGPVTSAAVVPTGSGTVHVEGDANPPGPEKPVPRIIPSILPSVMPTPVPSPPPLSVFSADDRASAATGNSAAPVARVDSAKSQSVGCGGCATAASSNDSLPTTAGVFALVGLGVKRRRRRQS